MYVDSVDSISHVVTLYKCRPEADICINALLAQLDCVRGTAPRSVLPAPRSVIQLSCRGTRDRPQVIAAQLSGGLRYEFVMGL